MEWRDYRSGISSRAKLVRSVGSRIGKGSGRVCLSATATNSAT